MRRTRSNPYGRPAGNTEIVSVGKRGKFTHIKGQSGLHLCRSGIKSGTVPPIRPSDAQFATCYRCQKLADINVRKGLAPDDDRG